MDVHHPLVRSVLAPALLALVLCGVLRRLAGPRWAAAGTAFALLVACTWVVGWPPRGASLVGKLPWTVLAAALLGAVLEAARARPAVQWLSATAVWALALLALGVTTPLAAGLAWIVGAAVLGAVLGARADTADAPALLAVAALGLAGVAMLSASLLLLELALGGALALAGTAPWLWPRTRIAFGPLGRVTATLAWLALAYATARLTQASPAALLLLALGFAAGPVLDRWPRAAHPAWARPLWRAAGAAACAAAAVASTLAGSGGATGTPVPPGESDSYPYYTPRW
ncbi:MAG: hypothetical protein JSR41_10180 [Proteobacteria bacterium]|nr:hypothetical protein [Pseudomonadota bacterium]